MWQTGDRVKETSTSTGSGDFSLLGAVAQFIAFSAICANGDNVFYAIIGQTGTEWEVGYGTWVTGNTLQRTQVLASSNAGSAVNFSAGTKDVFLTYPGQQGLSPSSRNVISRNTIVPAASTLYVAGELEVASGVELEVGLDATVHVG